nr:hypothetical protein [Actinomycetota bacterium]
FVNFMRTMLPGWIEGGRQEVTKQMTNAKVMSEFAIAQGRNEAGKAVLQAGEAVSNLTARRTAPPAQRPPAARAGQAPATAHAEGDGTSTAASTPSAAASPASAGASISSNGPRPSADALAIPGYDSLAASQVVQRLGGLSSAELEAVRDYEAATRARRTILNKVGQLQAETQQ